MEHINLVEEVSDGIDIPRFSVKELNDIEIYLMNRQNAVLSKLDNVGFGVKVTEDIYFPMPSFLNDNNFPVEIYQDKTDTLICFDNWEELEEYTRERF